MADKCTAHSNDPCVRSQQRNIEKPATEYIFLFLGKYMYNKLIGAGLEPTPSK